MANTVENMSGLTKSINVVCLLFFILQNAETLNMIQFVNPFTGNAFYLSITAIIFVFVGIIAIIALAGTNVMGSGLNEETTTTIRKNLFGLLEITIYITPLSFYLFPFGLFGVVLMLFDIIIILVGKISIWSEK